MDYRFNIALIYDFDGTLAPGNMQEYDFIPAVGKSNKEFWTEANTLAEEQDADMVLTYMARMLQEAKSKGLSLRREAFQESGRRVTLYKGVREWFGRINAYGAARGIRILHYINSSGMKEIIEGTELSLIHILCSRDAAGADPSAGDTAFQAYLPRSGSRRRRADTAPPDRLLCQLGHG